AIDENAGVGAVYGKLAMGEEERLEEAVGGAKHLAKKHHRQPRQRKKKTAARGFHAVAAEADALHVRPQPLEHPRQVATMQVAAWLAGRDEHSHEASYQHR